MNITKRSAHQVSRSSTTNKGAVGRRYRRMDEIGTPFCVTVDNANLEDQTVTIRHRDSMEQERMNMSHLAEFFEKR